MNTFPSEFDNGSKFVSNDLPVTDDTLYSYLEEALARKNQATESTQMSFDDIPQTTPEPPTPVYDPSSMYPRPSTTTPKLTDTQIKKYIDAKCWVNGIYLDSLDTEYLVNCKKFASQRLYDKWYWKFFLNLVNEEILNRDVAIGPKRYYPGTENIPRRGDSKGRGYRTARYRER